MKNRKNLIIAFVIAALLVIGVGYAAIADIALNVGGSATVQTDESNFSVVLSSESDGVVISNNDHTATITAGSTLVKAGDQETFVITVENASPELSAKLHTYVESEVSTNDYFTVTITNIAEDTVLAANGTTTITVVVTLKKAVTDTQTCTFSCSVKATAVQPAA